ncbi:hypothetical protein SAY86_011777 [Trapa natans]|uniref:Receptor-like serine/threonine-protein kinase n=1 Tax=Trapa natans TaxID=22666 RepID=A0AAN7LMV1_TRANT|nr:hypothetical protein SAY86_011777 [Trapa natans]
MSKYRETDDLHMLLQKFFLCICLRFFLLKIPFSHGTDTLTVSVPISDYIGATLVSSGGRSVLGFFCQGTSGNRYAGIWYLKDPHTVIWVANRDSPLPNDESGIFSLKDDGNLGLSSKDGVTHWSTKVKAADVNSNRTAKLLDSGNLVLSEISQGGELTLLWQSFDDPSHMDLSRMLKQENFKLTSLNGPYEQPDPSDLCNHFNSCGEYGVCNSQQKTICRCLPGFKPRQPNNWRQGDFSQGCERTSLPSHGKPNQNTFEELKFIKIGTKNKEIESTSLTQCKEECLRNCRCQAYSYNHNRSTATGRCLIWSHVLSDVQEGIKDGYNVSFRVSSGNHLLHCKTSSSFLCTYFGLLALGTLLICAGSSCTGKHHYIIYLVVVGILALVITVGCRVYVWRKLARERVAKREAILKHLAFHHISSENRINLEIISDQFAEHNEEGINVPFMDMEIILESTNYFSDENKLGQGGFGSVYKGKFPGGQEIAVKRLSSSSVQGFEQFKTEVLLIAQLQHRNLVRLLGYCTNQEEKLLIYEYMPNKSLDFFIFDPKRCLRLSWETRMRIILGIARGMLYLHEDSRLIVIHRDLKASNILLDEEMNPKISDFGLARIFEGKQTAGCTDRVIGTYGYMSPEYALEGSFSTKSDVFSFGIVVLEIISGKRNTGFIQTKIARNVLTYAWRLWIEGNAVNLVEPMLEGNFNGEEAVKCIKLALLCVQNDPQDRPTMSNIVSTLNNENATLPDPKQPAFLIHGDSFFEASSSQVSSMSGQVSSMLEISNSLHYGR